MNWKTKLLTDLKNEGVELNETFFQFIDDAATTDKENKINIHRDIYQRRSQQLISRIKSIFGLNLSTIYARDTHIVKLKKEQAAQFIDENHLMGFGGGKTFLGLRDDTELVAVAVFSKIMFMKYENPPYYSVELERYCSLMDMTVVGGLDKVIKAYLKEHTVDDIVTYVDKEFLTLFFNPPQKVEGGYGTSYEKLGFEVIRETEPLTFRVSKKTWERELVRDALPLNPPPKEEGYYFVKNKGNLKLRLKVT